MIITHKTRFFYFDFLLFLNFSVTLFLQIRVYRGNLFTIEFMCVGTGLPDGPQIMLY